MKRKTPAELKDEYAMIRAERDKGKNVQELIALMSRTHYYDHLYNNGGCPCGLMTMEKESTEVRDEKIARIVKEFRQEFAFILAPDFSWEKLAETERPYKLEGKIEAWLTQTLTTLLNEE